MKKCSPKLVADVVTKPEFARRAGVTPRAIDLWTAKGKIEPPLILGSRRVWPRRYVDELLGVKP